DLVDLDLSGLRHRHLHHFGEVAAVREVEAHAHAASFREFCLAPARLLGNQLEHAAHPLALELRATALAATTRRLLPWWRLYRTRGRLQAPHQHPAGTGPGLLRSPKP